MNQHKGSAKFNSSSIIRSMPASPSLGAARDAPDPKAISTSMPPTVPNDRTQKLRAIRTPLIHFLAARPASTKLLITHLGCKEDEIIELLQKVGKKHRLIPDKWTLTDKAFKELDVWNFDYPNQDDRQLAIDCAISAFDRMRLSTQEKYWDMLLPKQERGKGKILSNLDLHKGPIQQSSTPRIQVQYPSSEPNKKESANGHESDQKDRLAPSDAEPKARSKSHNQIKKTKASEKEAQSKRLLCKGPKKPTPTPKATEVHPAVKKGGGGKKGNAPKSSEFVNESDEEDGLEDAAVSYNQPTTPKQSSVPAETSNVAAPTPSTTTTPKSVGTSAKTSKSTLSAPPVESKLLVREKGSKSSTASNSQLSSNSKPVVANRASGNGAKSEERRSENIPSTLSSSVQDKKGATSTPSSPAPRHRTSEASQGSMTMKKTHSRQRTISSPHKPSPLGSSPPTNASDLENSVRSSSSSASMLSQSQKNNATPNGLGLTVNGQGRKTSEHYLKRKADEVDSDIHAHGSPLINGNATSSKRYKTSHVSPPTSESSISPPATSHTLVRAQDFKAYYAKYEIMYREVSESDDPPQEKIENVKKMHQRLTELKDELSRRARKSGEEGRRT